MAEECIFCRIVAGEVPARIVLREPGVVAFHDIAPKAPVHILVVPARHVPSMAAVGEMPAGERADMLEAIARAARAAGLEDGGYRVVTNHGPDALQSVWHLHWHVLGGRRLSDSM